MRDRKKIAKKERKTLPGAEAIEEGGEREALKGFGGLLHKGC